MALEPKNKERVIGRKGEDKKRPLYKEEEDE